MTATPATGPVILHASTVAWDNRAVLIIGAAGSGKSGLALDLMALGCTLVADDRTVLARQGPDLHASAPPATKGLIEARFIGILSADIVEDAKLALVIDLDETETERLPQYRRTVILDVALPLLHKVDTPHFAASILQYMKAGRRE